MAEPNLRFKRDDGTPFPAWADVRFGDVFTEIVRKTSDTQTYPLFSLTIENGVTAKTDRYERSHLLKKDEDNYKIVPPRAFVYNPMNLRFGALAASHENREVSVSQYYNVFVLNDETTLSFWEYYLVSDAMLQYYFSIATGSLIEKLRVHFSSFVNITKPVPCAEEQKKIADFLSSVDEVIAASEEEVANLETQKKAAMKKVFSQDVRFKRADGSDFPEWEVKPFEEIALLMTASIDPSKAVKMHCVELEHLEQGSGQRLGFVEAENQSSKKRLFETGDVLFGKLRPYLRKYWLATEEGCCSTEIWVLRPLSGVMSEYLLAIVSSDDFISVANTSEGTKMPRATWDLVANAEFPVPSFEEQSRISDFLSDFDEAIAAAKKELKLWKDLKKGLLQQMFV